MPTDGDRARSTYYDQPVMTIDDTALVETISGTVGQALAFMPCTASALRCTSFDAEPHVRVLAKIEFRQIAVKVLHVHVLVHSDNRAPSAVDRTGIVDGPASIHISGVRHLNI
jgi:hypothetical protein